MKEFSNKTLGMLLALAMAYQDNSVHKGALYDLVEDNCFEQWFKDKGVLNPDYSEVNAFFEKQDREKWDKVCEVFYYAGTNTPFNEMFVFHPEATKASLQSKYSRLMNVNALNKAIEDLVKHDGVSKENFPYLLFFLVKGDLLIKDNITL